MVLYHFTAIGIRVKSSDFKGMVLYHFSAIGIYLKLIDFKYMVLYYFSAICIYLKLIDLKYMVVSLTTAPSTDEERTICGSVWYALQLERFGGSIVALTKPNYVWCFSGVSCRSLLAH